MYKTILFFFSLTLFTTSPLYAALYSFNWIFHSVYATFQVRTTISIPPNGSQTISHILPPDFEFSLLMTGKSDREHDRNIPKGPIKLTRANPATKRYSQNDNKSSQQVMPLISSVHDNSSRAQYQPGFEE